MKERQAPIRGGRIGGRVCVAGVVPLGLFAVRAVITLALTGDIPGNFILFRPRLPAALRRSGADRYRASRRSWARLGPAARRSRGHHVAVTLNIDPIHDIGPFAFEGAWVALGIALPRMERQG